MAKYTEEQILENVLNRFAQQSIAILAPVVRSRKGHYRELFEQLRKQGYTKVRIDGQMQDLRAGMQIDRYKVHDIEVVIDRLTVSPDKAARLSEDIRTAMRQSAGLMAVLDLDTQAAYPYSRNLMCPESGISYDEPSPNTFSFNSPYGMCPHCKGLGEVQEVDLDAVIPDYSKSINEVGIVPLGEVRDNNLFRELRTLSKKYKFSFSTPIRNIPEKALHTILYGGTTETVMTSPFTGDEWSYSVAQEGLVNMLKRWYADTGSERMRKWAENFLRVNPCPECGGSRLKKESLWFKIGGKNIAELAEMDLGALYAYLENIEDAMSDRQKAIARDVLKEIRFRLRFLLQVGLDYLSLNRSSRTLSGGESQRIRLATQIGSQLTGITYILDEPSIGLHQRDNQRLIESLKHLRDIGNTVLVVEHDRDIMLQSDYLIDLGPGAGRLGGQIVDEGTPETFMANRTATSDYLAGRSRFEIPAARRKGNGNQLVLTGCSGHNLKNVTLRIPLGTFVCVTGVSGSGKSSLINETLFLILQNKYHRSLARPLPYQSIEAWSTSTR